MTMKDIKKIMMESRDEDEPMTKKDIKKLLQESMEDEPMTKKDIKKLLQESKESSDEDDSDDYNGSFKRKRSVGGWLKAKARDDQRAQARKGKKSNAGVDMQDMIRSGISAGVIDVLASMRHPQPQLRV